MCTLSSWCGRIALHQTYSLSFKCMWTCVIDRCSSVCQVHQRHLETDHLTFRVNFSPTRFFFHRKQNSSYYIYIIFFSFFTFYQNFLVENNMARLIMFLHLWSQDVFHILNDNGSSTFYIDVFFHLSLPRLWPDLTVYILVTKRVSYKKQELLTLREYLSSPPVFGGVRIGHLFSFLCVVLLHLYVSLRSEFRVVVSVMISA